MAAEQWFRDIILTEIERLKDDNKELSNKLQILHSDMVEIKTAIKIKQGILGFIAAGIGAIISALVERFSR